MDMPEEEKAGIPAWVMTFADLMSLLMCFFVLLLSFAEMDAMKFKQIAGELTKAFGVQRDVPAIESPMGTTPIFDKFSPGPPKPTPIDTVRQETSKEDPKLKTYTSNASNEAMVREVSERQVSKSADELRKTLEKELGQGTLQLDEEKKRIVIRIEERGAFPSGSADLAPAFADVARRIGESLADIPGEIAIEGHTDDIPISTARFRSNWDLSAARASSVANALLATGTVAPGRLRVHGFAETRPRVENTSAALRAQNRRVEIVIDMSGPIEVLENRARQLIGGGHSELLPFMGWQAE
ncbi:MULTISPECIES: flagellar motor protein MotB [unclassified Thauera]|uniref:flagellar motor protein MotB n=1 Tax=unclassified Thauera TaxID=2609274 RepID=UPI0002CE754B|nr:MULTISPECIES: flagellar motor protein MotB [unclassified Thauera]ENO80769.1 flagellar motor protein MotB [Thauera sp. 27]ENO91653.1 flagellar motor protein MotB [Thauera sp. 28]HAG74612.1 type VI secretion system protein TssL [Thauera sp.]HAY09171.1 type VI secretion system protein TssL [Thauera sp.]